MKLDLTLFVVFTLFSLTTYADSTTPKSQAKAAMLSACQKEFPNKVKGKSLDQLDEWAESQENGSESADFKKSKCFKNHEVWEKLAQRNEWDPAKVTRLPASISSP